jgi:hypothetical protein
MLGALGSLWGFSVIVDYLKNIEKGWIFYKKGMQLVATYFNV